MDKEITDIVQNIYLAVQDAEEELNYGQKKMALECLDIANNYCQLLIRKLEDMNLMVKMNECYYRYMGINVPYGDKQ